MLLYTRRISIYKALISSELYWTSPGGNTSQNSSHLPPITKTNLDKPDMRDTTGEVRTNS